MVVSLVLETVEAFGVGDYRRDWIERGLFLVKRQPRGVLVLGVRFYF